jgi:SAM-dependent methyltransferase
VSDPDRTDFQAYAHYYDLIYQSKAYGAEADRVLALINADAPLSFFEMGCGTGLHAAAMAEHGHTVHGIDLSPQMLARAESRLAELPAPLSARLSFEQGDVRTYRTNRQFDCVTSLFHVASYQTGTADLEKMVQTAHTHLKPGGTFVFDFWYGPAVLTDPPVVRIKRMNSDTVRIIRLAEPEHHPNENRVDVHYRILVINNETSTVQELHEVHRMRYWFLPEVSDILERNGFTLRTAQDLLSGQQPGIDTWAICVAADKVGPPEA